MWGHKTAQSIMHYSFTQVTGFSFGAYGFNVHDLYPTFHASHRCHGCVSQLRQIILALILSIPPFLRPIFRYICPRWERPPVPTCISGTAHQIAQPIRLAITLGRIRTMHSWLAKDYVPSVLQHSSTCSIIELSVCQPFPIVLPVFQSLCPDLFPCRSELCAACDSDDWGNWCPRE